MGKKLCAPNHLSKTNKHTPLNNVFEKKNTLTIYNPFRSIQKNFFQFVKTKQKTGER